MMAILPIKERIEALRKILRGQKLSGYIITGSDPHLSEYVPLRWKTREFISGFTGSAGVVVITADQGALFTDSRYFLQAEEQLKDSGIELIKEGLPGSATMEQWLEKVLAKGEKVGIDQHSCSIAGFESLSNLLKTKNITLKATEDLLDKIWEERPELPSAPPFVVAENVAGSSVKEKVAVVQELLEQQSTDSILLTALDDIAWLFNLRGDDIPFNPVVSAYALINKKSAILFLPLNKQTSNMKEYAAECDFLMEDYTHVNTLLPLYIGCSVCVDPNKTNQGLLNSIPAESVVYRAVSPVVALKAIKNPTEQEGIRRAMVKDGTALVRVFKWIEEEVEKEQISELDVVERLHQERKQEMDFVEDSFASIVGYGPHGAIVHYEANTTSNAVIRPNQFLLIDSGGQYQHGTTDITRTWLLGEATQEMKSDYTKVLQGHIGIATCRFPQGTRGAQIDILARKNLWDAGLNYLHGTGHGVGFFLNVHEGPQNIRLNENPTPLQPGMLTSNEPGIYRAGKYGIRTENLTLVKEDISTEFGLFYSFETVTLFPIDTRAIDLKMISEQEIEWINHYHQRVEQQLCPYLNKDEEVWLKEKCKPIYK